MIFESMDFVRKHGPDLTSNNKRTATNMIQKYFTGSEAAMLRRVEYQI